MCRQTISNLNFELFCICNLVFVYNFDALDVSAIFQSQNVCRNFKRLRTTELKDGQGDAVSNVFYGLLEFKFETVCWPVLWGLALLS